jgi:hypothetical protein
MQLASHCRGEYNQNGQLTQLTEMHRYNSVKKKRFPCATTNLPGRRLAFLDPSAYCCLRLGHRLKSMQAERQRKGEVRQGSLLHEI